MFLNILQDPNWVSIVNTLGFPVAVALLLALFLFKVVWPWMTDTFQSYLDQNKEIHTQYIANLETIRKEYKDLVQELKLEAKERDRQYREEDARREKEYKEVLQQQLQQNISTLETINANTIAMQSLSSAVEKMRDAAKLEERLAELEKKNNT